MRIRRQFSALLATALVASTAALVGGTIAPASAATIGTKIVGLNGKPWIYSSYRTQPGAPAAGDTLTISVDVVADSGNDPFDGDVTVSRKLAGSTKWTVIATSTYPGLYKSVKAVSNATYKADYTGGSSSSDTWTPSTSSKSVKVQRNLNITPKSGQKLFLNGKVLPTYARKPVTIQKKVGNKWKKYSTVKTSATSKFSARVAAPAKRGGKITYRVYIGASKTFTTTTSGPYTATKG